MQDGAYFVIIVVFTIEKEIFKGLVINQKIWSGINLSVIMIFKSSYIINQTIVYFWKQSIPSPEQYSSEHCILNHDVNESTLIESSNELILKNYEKKWYNLI